MRRTMTGLTSRRLTFMSFIYCMFSHLYIMCRRSRRYQRYARS
jgi:hypothetical protein